MALAFTAVVMAVGCAGKRIESGVFYSPKGYRVGLPGSEWTVVESSRADLELRHREARAAMLANATCGDGAPASDLDVLSRHLLMGFRSRAMVESGAVSVNGRRAAHAVLDSRLVAGDELTRVETYVMKDGRCVYDFALVAPSASFESWREAFGQLVESFATE
ncbi:MAG: hypothetical protein DMD98_08940 [Candidatus Rokuibacteriota bacterium]|nr:MAG: hypothetical protein AUH14_10040 [Candidatus Rokubacteria bacterium 13_2_20CM_69_15_1]OLB51177.1 MAG: hypothetical protein AUH99_08150 [Candidatus Rokubacteria bacterium 13_2_20CM_2_70_11]PYN35349.1 MAG: hypothetical protein DMD98_08940 [Candidatus Rokubacteria bacterium]